MSIARENVYKLRDLINVRAFGAVGDGATDDSAAIQAAINANPGRGVFFPVGEYLITSTITITTPLTWLVGEISGRAWAVAGQGGAVIVCNAATDAVVFSNSSAPTGALHGCGVRDIAIMRTADVATGAGLKLVDTTYFTVENLSVQEFFTCVQMVGAQSTLIDRLICYTGNVFTYRADSALVKVSGYVASPSGDQVGWINSITQAILTSARASDYGVWVESIDDLRFSDSYIGFLRTAGMLLKMSGVAAPLYSVNVDQVYFDGVTLDGTQTVYGVRVASDGLTQTSFGVFDLKFTGCTFGQHTVNFYADEATTNTVAFTGCHFHNSEQNSVKLGAGTGVWAFTGCHWFKPGYDNVGNTWSAIRCDGAASVSVSGGSVSNVLDNTRVFAFGGTIPSVTVQGVAINGAETFTFADLYTVGATIARLRFDVVSNSATPSRPFAGSFTPVITFGGGSTGIAYSARNGRYTREGNVVTAWIVITLSSKGSSTGNLAISGLFYPSASPITSAGSAVLLGTTAGSLDFGAQCFVDAGASEVWVYKGGSTGHVRMTDADFTNASSLYLTISYLA